MVWLVGLVGCICSALIFVLLVALVGLMFVKELVGRVVVAVVVLLAYRWLLLVVGGCRCCCRCFLLYAVGWFLL